MKIVEKKLGCVLLKPTVIYDNRGWFQIAVNTEELLNLGLPFNKVIQLNHSMTEIRGIVRGPNYQQVPYNQAKIIRVIKGSAYSVGIDIDPQSASYGMAAGFLLSDSNKYLMFIPNTYAHGFTVLENGTELEYLTDNQFNKAHAKSIWYADDSIIDIDSGMPIDWTYNGAVVLSDIKSDKNKEAPLLREASLYYFKI